MTTRTMVYILCLMIAIGFSGWYYVHQHHMRQFNQKPSKSYDYYAKQVDFLQYDEKGTMTRHYHSANLQHYKNKGLTQLDHPTLILHRPNAPVWTVTANKGRAINDDKITLWQHVRIVQMPDKTHPGSTITTEYLEYYPKKQFATTNELITYQQPDSRIQSHGMRAYFAEERVQLLSATRGQYAKVPTT